MPKDLRYSICCFKLYDKKNTYKYKYMYIYINTSKFMIFKGP